jgi:hypothetical protein
VRLRVALPWRLALEVLPQVLLEPRGPPLEPPPELVLDYRLAGQLSLVWKAL